MQLPGIPHAIPTEREADLTRGALAVLDELGSLLGERRHRFALIGGLVPVLRLDSGAWPHVGSGDIDLALDPDDWLPGELAATVDGLVAAGYEATAGRGRFQLVRTLPGATDPIEIDFLLDRDLHGKSGGLPTLVDGFPLLTTQGLDAVFRLRRQSSATDDEHRDRSPRPASIATYLAMKTLATGDRYKPKDLYDIHYCVKRYPGGHQAFAREYAPLRDHASGAAALDLLTSLFADADAFGPVCVRRFMEDRGMPEDEALRWQDDAFQEVNALLYAVSSQPPLRGTDHDAND